MRHQTLLNMIYVCPICNNPYQPYRITQQTCSTKCRNAKTSKDTALIRSEKIKAKGTGKTYLKDKGRHIHRTLAEKMLGRALLPGEIVHHKDGNKLNNSLDNLEVLPSQSVHAKSHYVNGRFRKVVD